jgi:hypothetical protein
MHDGERPEVILGIGVMQNRTPDCLRELRREARKLVDPRVAAGGKGDEGQPAILGAKHKPMVSALQNGFLGFSGICCTDVEAAAELAHVLPAPFSSAL